MEAIILAGGLGTRLGTRIIGMPKPMAPVGGRPFLQILIDRLIDFGCARVILSVGHLYQAIMDFFGDSYRGVPIAYSIEESPLGTGGAIRLALQSANGNAVLVLNGDTFMQVDFAELDRAHESEGRPLTMVVTYLENASRYGGVVVNQSRVTGFTEKGRAGTGWINAGTYVLDRDFPWPGHLPECFSFEFDVLVPFVARLHPAAFICRGYFLDIGIPEDFLIERRSN